MKAILISFVVGLVVGVVYALIRVKSPAPPLVALAGLLGMVWGEQAAARYLIKPPAPRGAKAPVTEAAGTKANSPLLQLLRKK